jgi:pimeloyl-ACP methyl ester carboxylesterase
MATVAPGGLLRDRLTVPDSLPAWLSETDLDFYVGEFERTGLTGGLNRYRNVDRDWEDFAAFTKRPIVVPSMFIGGDRDGPTRWGARDIARFDENLPQLRGSHILKGCGHWTQQERPREVNQLLIDFLRKQ